MDVALCAPYGLARVSGVSTFLLSLEASLRTRGHRVRVLTPDGNAWLRRLPPRMMGVGLSAWTFWTIVRDRTGWTAVHANQPHLQSLAALIAARVKGARAVVTYHSPMPPAQRRAAAWGQELSHRVVAKRSDTLAFVSQATKNLYAGASGPVVYIGIDTKETDRLLRSAPQSKGPFTFTFAGRQTRTKGFFDVLAAAERLAASFGKDAFRLSLMGDFPVEEAAERQNWLDRLHSVVEDHGTLTPQDAVRRMAGAQALVMPSYGEGLPLVVLQAMAVGCVPIVSPVGGIPEVVEDRITGVFVTPGNVAALAEVMAWAIRHPADIAAMGERAAERVRASWSFDRTLGRYLSFYAGKVAHGEAQPPDSSAARDA